MSVKVKVVIRTATATTAVDSHFSQIYRFLTMDTKRETTTVLARNNGSGAYRG